MTKKSTRKETTRKNLTVRMDPTLAEKFKRFCDERGLIYGWVLERLIEAYLKADGVIAKVT